MKRCYFPQRKIAEPSNGRFHQTRKTHADGRRQRLNCVHVPDNWNANEYPIHNLKELERRGRSIFYCPSIAVRGFQPLGLGLLTGRRALRLPQFAARASDWRACVMYTKNEEKWWRRTGSNRRPEACKATALPTELRPPIASPLDDPPNLDDTPDAKQK